MSSDTAWLDAPRLRRRYGDKSNTTIQRWLDDPELQFPQPVMIRGKRFWCVDELDAFDQRMRDQGIRLRRHTRAEAETQAR